MQLILCPIILFIIHISRHSTVMLLPTRYCYTEIVQSSSLTICIMQSPMLTLLIVKDKRIVSEMSYAR